MIKNYLFAGGSSLIALAASAILKGAGHRVTALSTKRELADYDQLLAVEKYAEGFFPTLDEPLDGLVYFPGNINLKPFHRLTKKDFEEDMQLNAFGAAACVQAYLPNLKKSPNSSIVFISSVAVQTGLPFHSSIAMAKGALEGLTKSLAAEFAPTIRVNCIAPSLVDTNMGSKFVNTPEKREAMEKRNPLKKVGSPIEVAEAICFLLSDSSSWTTGQILAVDGGMASLRVG